MLFRNRTCRVLSSPGVLMQGTPGADAGHGSPLVQLCYHPLTQSHTLLGPLVFQKVARAMWAGCESQRSRATSLKGEGHMPAQITDILVDHSQTSAHTQCKVTSTSEDTHSLLLISTCKKEEQNPFQVVLILTL